MSSGGLPYGNAFLVQTPSLDRYGLQLYQEQRQKEAEAQQESKQLDQNMQSEVGKIRAADTPEFIAQYQKYKDIKKQLYNPKVQRNATEVNKITQAANVELAKAMQLANDSIEYKERLKGVNSEYAKNPYYFNDDFKDRWESANSTPLSQITKHPKYGDLSAFDNFYYKGNITNLQPVLDKAKGTARPVGQPEVNESFSPVERQITTYKGLNSPRQYYNALVGSLRGSRAQKDLITSFSFTPEEEQKIVDQYTTAVKNNPVFAKAYGLDQLDFPESADYSDVGRTAKLLAMEHGLQALTVETKRETKKDESMNKAAGIALARQKEMAAIHDMYTMKHIGYKAALDLGNIIATDSNVDELFNKMGNNLPAGLVNKVFDIPKDEQGHEFPPPSIKKSEDGNNYVFYYGTPGEKGYYEKQVPVAIVKTQWKQDVGTALKTKTNIPAANKPPTGSHKKVYNPKTGKYE